MKKLATMLAAFMTFSSAVFAAEGSGVSMTGISPMDDGLVCIGAKNLSEQETRITLKVVKLDEENTAEQNTYEALQTRIQGLEETEFIFQIPDERNGISGSGTYEVSMQTGDGTIIKETFCFATEDEVSAFVTNLKAASAQVEDADKAYEKMLPVIIPVDDPQKNAGELFRMGIDYDLFDEKSEEVQNEAINLLYKSDISEADAGGIADKLAVSMGLAIYNVGDKTEGISMLPDEYGSGTVDKKLLSGVIEIMDLAYDSPEELEKGFKLAYGIEAINTSHVNKLSENLKNFRDETGECTSVINKILGLSKTKAYIAYESIAESLKISKATNVTQLSDVLNRAYKAATAASAGSQSSGGGGSNSGGGGGATPVSQNYMGGASGSGEPEERASVFPDLEAGHWAEESVEWAKTGGIISGTDAGLFEPDRAVTREEFTKMIILACGITADSEEVSFSDTEDGAWYIPYIAAAAESGVVKGIEEQTFGIGYNITRQDMAVMAQRAASAKGMELSAVREYIAFADSDGISDYAVEAVRELYCAGIINGKCLNMFDPTGNATRAEAVKIIYEAFGRED